MSRITTDILISGGGVAGLCAAAAFASAGFSVVCADPTPPVTGADDKGADLRTTAFLQPSIPVLEGAGIWSRLEPFAAPLQIMRIVDAGGPSTEPRIVKNFDASDISTLPFGWNLPNWLLRREMLSRLAELPLARFLPGVATTTLLTRENEAAIGLSDGGKVLARLVVAADGRNSTMREALGIPVKTMRYGQKALAFSVSHQIPHQNVSTEIHRTGGPFTLVPLRDREGKPSSAVVWMETGPEVERLAGLTVQDFETEANIRSCGILGQIALTSPRSVWPIISQVASHMVGERVALMAEAAHVVPPIGAQGLNMSLADLTVLLDLARADPLGLGSAKMLDAYHRRRHFDILTRVKGIDALNRASMLGAQSLRDMRASVLNAIYSIDIVRTTLMKAGLGMQ